ncbi:phosphomethylpyrimidine synthase ThiC [Natranaerofaba carboxydovora]|uniref:phosphomethylpyrimidine synthase ThiC n=1 Tax=Natranaerofaba carboxydovora TaxID=2742683 RepID=UPI001F13769E|nr:phosphomethylpyrimidine synthase ThiC [Natranaerofaba carboxydovora]UMZ74777.1 Phosphomethylpyrimidine synthase [Natranaerofaba carboxydovora]
MLLLEKAKRGEITKEMEKVAKIERVDVEKLREGIARGKIVIPYNNRRGSKINTNVPEIEPKGIGEGLTVKVNANIGTSEALSSIDTELRKLDAAVEGGADAVMDLSTGYDIDKTRKQVIAQSSIPVGGVPVYQTATELRRKEKPLVEMNTEDIFDVIRRQSEDGMDFVTVHCGLTLSGIERLKQQGRICDIVSRGGAMLTGWMVHNQKENPLYEEYDKLLDIAREYDLTLSLGDGLRPGSVLDATDRAQIQELLVLGELVDRAREADVQVMVEGPGHVKFNRIRTNMEIAKELCNDAPFYVLGPLVTDIAPGYDHITSAVGGTLAAVSGADFLCYVTPTEHLGLPGEKEVKEGVVASKIAAHAADISLGNEYSLERDRQMSIARKELNWEKQVELSLDPERAKQIKKDTNPQKDKDTEDKDSEDKSTGEECSMCGQYCAMKIADEALK